MRVIQLPETRNETILIQWKKCTFSENIYAWFESDLQPVFSNKMEDLMLPENRVIQQNHFANGDENENVYEVFAWNDSVHQHLYAGRLYTPKNSPKLV
jgi:hypothetical protein